jgi:hypothetical protein
VTYYISVEPTRFKEDGRINGAPLIVRHHRHDTPHYTQHVDIQGPSRLVFNTEFPLPDGTKAWIETEGPVTYMEMP